MTFAQLSVESHTKARGVARQIRENAEEFGLEPGAEHPRGGFLFLKHPTFDELTEIYAMTLREIGDTVAPFPVVKSVYDHNPVSFWAFMRSEDECREGAELVGYCSFLPLNDKGLSALRTGTLSAAAPVLALLAPKAMRPAALYLWAVVAHGTADLGSKLLGHAFGLDFYERLPIFGTVGTESGKRALQKAKNSPQAETAGLGTFFEVRHPKKFIEEMRALNVTFAPKMRTRRPKLEARLAATPDDIAKVFALRAAVFLAEQDCPFEEEFDGNDYAGAQILGLVNGEPAAVLRVRYFADFVKLERLAVLPRFRRTLIAKTVVDRAIEICRRKGYTKMYGHAQKRLVGLWQRFGFTPMSKNTPLVFSDHEYVEMIGAIAPHDMPLTPFSDPYILIRPEGRWDSPGVLDRSSARAATNPQRDRHHAAAGVQ